VNPVTVQCPPHSTDRPDCAPTTTTHPEPTSTTVIETTTPSMPSSSTISTTSLDNPTTTSARVETATTEPVLPATGSTDLFGTLGLLAVMVGASLLVWARRWTR